MSLQAEIILAVQPGPRTSATAFPLFLGYGNANESMPE